MHCAPRRVPLFALSLVASLLVGLGACRSGDGKDDTDDTPTTDTHTTTPTGYAAESAVWLETFTYEWVLFNHRISYLQVEADDPPRAAIIGGTSTTGQPSNLTPECEKEFSSCREFPAWDDTLVTVGWGSVSTDAASFATATAEAVVPAEGTTVTITAPAPEREGELSAVLQGFSLDTNYDLTGGEACYKPEYGWHPRRIAVALSAPRRNGDLLEVDVTMQFTAGNTDDPDRVCIDEVNEQSQVPMTAGVLFVVGPAATAVPVSQEGAYPFSGNVADPGDQVPPDPVSLGLNGDGLRGWSKLDWTFNPGNAEERGAYLRTLVARIDGDEASGTATNYSPITQLHDFAFAFEGTVTHVPLDGVTHNVVDGTLPTGLEDDGTPILYSLDGNTPTE